MTAPTVADLRELNDPPGVDNPYWQIVRQFPTSRLRFTGEPWSPEGFGFDFKTYEKAGPSRDELVRRYAWAIPDPAAVAFVAEHGAGGILEIGAGAGYWAWQIRQRGVPVIAYDVAPPDVERNTYCIPAEQYEDRTARRPTYHPVIKSDGRKAAWKFPEAALFLCWPPMSSMAAEALAAYSGDRVIYIGEGEGGCTADDDFHGELDQGWTEIATHRPVQWGGIHDVITIYRRGAAS